MNGSRWTCLLVLPLAVMLLSGCRSTSLAAGEASSPTGGIAVEMFTRGANLEAVYYRVTPAGRIKYAGGYRAHERETQWEGPITAEEITRLRELLEADGWWTGTVTTTGQPASRQWEIDVARPAGGERYRLTGNGEAVLRLRGLLDEMASKRLDPFLQTLPKAGEPVNPG